MNVLFYRNWRLPDVVYAQLSQRHRLSSESIGTSELGTSELNSKSTLGMRDCWTSL